MPSPAQPRSGVRTPLSERRLAHKLLSHADLRDIRLCECVLSHDMTTNRPFKRVEIAIHVHSLVRPHTEGTSPVIVVTANFTMSARPADTDDSLTGRFIFQLKYFLDDDTPRPLDDASVNAFAKWIGLNNIWPYAREFVQQMTARMGFIPLRLPLYRPEDHDIVTVSSTPDKSTKKRTPKSRRKKRT
jgi:hypothetical protein